MKQYLNRFAETRKLILSHIKSIDVHEVKVNFDLDERHNVTNVVIKIITYGLIDNLKFSEFRFLDALADIIILSFPSANVKFFIQQVHDDEDGEHLVIDSHHIEKTNNKDKNENNIVQFNVFCDDKLISLDSENLKPENIIKFKNFFSNLLDEQSEIMEDDIQIRKD